MRPQTGPEGVGVFQDERGEWRYVCDFCFSISTPTTTQDGALSALAEHRQTDGHAWQVRNAKELIELLYAALNDLPGWREQAKAALARIKADRPSWE